MGWKNIGIWAACLVGACGGTGASEPGGAQQGEAEAVAGQACAYLLRLPPAATGAITTRNNDMTRDMIGFIARAFVPASTRVEAFDGPEGPRLRVPCAGVPEQARDAFTRAAAATTHSGALSALRGLLIADCDGVTCYAKHRNARHEGCAIPATREELERWTGDYRATWARAAVVPSQVKGKPRIFYRDDHHTLGACRIVIAETLQTDEDVPGAVVRETEVIAARTDGSADWDYVVYDEAGQLSRTSDFRSSHGAAVVGPVPFTCMGCHYDKDARAFQNRPLSFQPSN